MATSADVDDPWLAAASIVATAADLVAIPSVTGSERDALQYVAEWLDAAGVPVEQWTVDGRELRTHPAHSADVVRDDVPVLAARVGRDEGGARLLVNAHVDVVAPGRGWRTDPFVPILVDGWLHGRGAVDSKGGLAAAMHVLAQLASDDQAGHGLSGQVLLTPVVGEEDGGSGTLATLVEPRPVATEVDAAIVVEPTALAVANASAGASCFRIDVAGRRAHGSVRHEGVSAIDKGVLVLEALRDLEVQRAAGDGAGDQAGPVCVGRLAAGDDRCDEATWLSLEGRLGVRPREDPEAAWAELVAAMAAIEDQWLQAHPPDVSRVGGQWLPASTPTDDAFVGLVAATAGTPLRAMPYGCDLGLLRHVAGTPGVVFGPGEVARAHGIDERVRVDDLASFARTLVATARNFCR